MVARHKLNYSALINDLNAVKTEEDVKNAYAKHFDIKYSA